MKKRDAQLKTGKEKRIKSLSAVNQMVGQKQSADLMRFRTCCCDPRASK